MIPKTNKKVVFKKRVPEPKEMGREEMKAFEKMSDDDYQGGIKGEVFILSK